MFQSHHAILKAVGWLQKYVGKTWKSFSCKYFSASFNYCQMVLNFATCESIRKTGKIQILCLRIVLDDCDSDYDVLLRESGKAMAEIKRLRVAAIEIFKTNNLIRNCMKDVFRDRLHRKIRQNVMYIGKSLFMSYLCYKKYKLFDVTKFNLVLLKIWLIQ